MITIMIASNIKCENSDNFGGVKEGALNDKKQKSQNYNRYVYLYIYIIAWDICLRLTASIMRVWPISSFRIRGEVVRLTVNDIWKKEKFSQILKIEFDYLDTSLAYE